MMARYIILNGGNVTESTKRKKRQVNPVALSRSNKTGVTALFPAVIPHPGEQGVYLQIRRPAIYNIMV